MDDAGAADAAAIDAALARGEDPGPLAGVPVTVKVNIDQKGCATTNGLRIQKDLIATEDSPPVANLRRAGAVIVGRTNTPAFSLRWFTRNSPARSHAEPRLSRPDARRLLRGAAAAVAAGMGAIAHGTDIAGSIRYPAYACGIHGLRPGLGRVPAFNATAGDRLIGGQLMATSGPLARSAADLRLALQAMSAPDPRDPWWAPATPAPYPRRVALAAAPDGLQTAPEIRAALEAAAQTLADNGWQVDTPPLPPLREAMATATDPLDGRIRPWRGRGPGARSRPRRQLRPRATGQLWPARPRWKASCARCNRVPASPGSGASSLPIIRWSCCPSRANCPSPTISTSPSAASFARVIEAQMPQIAPPFMGLPGLTVTTGRTATHPIGIQLLADRGREDILLDAADILAPEIAALG